MPRNPTREMPAPSRRSTRSIRAAWLPGHRFVNAASKEPQAWPRNRCADSRDRCDSCASPSKAIPSTPATFILRILSRSRAAPALKRFMPLVVDPGQGEALAFAGPVALCSTRRFLSENQELLADAKASAQTGTSRKAKSRWPRSPQERFEDSATKLLGN